MARETNATPRRPASVATRAASATLSAPRSPWSTWAAVTVRPREGASSTRAVRSAVESGPPEAATRRCSPGRGAPGASSEAASLRTSSGRSPATGASYTNPPAPRARGRAGRPRRRASGSLHAGLAGDLDVDTERRKPRRLLHDARQMDVAGGGAHAELEAGALPPPTRLPAHPPPPARCG